MGENNAGSLKLEHSSGSSFLNARELFLLLAIRRLGQAKGALQAFPLDTLQPLSWKHRIRQDMARSISSGVMSIGSGGRRSGSSRARRPSVGDGIAFHAEVAVVSDA